MFKMSPRIILLSDIFGFGEATWIRYYTERLEENFNLTLYDVRELAGLSKTVSDKETIHRDFIEGGINQAVENLLKIKQEDAVILGFSIGGTIGWKAALRGWNAKHLYLFSSTRIRLETEKPKCPTDLFFGANDKSKPADYWFENLDLKQTILPDIGHEFYKKPDIADFIIAKVSRKLLI